MQHTSDWDDKVKRVLKQFKNACWDANSEGEDVLGMSPQEAYDIFTYLEMIMDEKGIQIGSGNFGNK